jgi:hypothetical protein
MPRFFALVLAALLWIAWCMLVITELVPAIRRHVTMWPWLIAYFFCLAPVVILAAVIVARLRVHT